MVKYNLVRFNINLQTNQQKLLHTVISQQCAWRHRKNSLRISADSSCVCEQESVASFTQTAMNSVQLTFSC